jgi:hypothetical protein
MFDAVDEFVSKYTQLTGRPAALISVDEFIKIADYCERLPRQERAPLQQTSQMPASHDAGGQAFENVPLPRQQEPAAGQQEAPAHSQDARTGSFQSEEPYGSRQGQAQEGKIKQMEGTKPARARKEAREQPRKSSESNALAMLRAING